MTKFLRAFFLCLGLASSGLAADLVVYSPNSDGLLKATIPAFEKKYGIKVELISAGTGELFKRLQGEANSPYADVVFGGAYATYVANQALLQGKITPYALDGSVILVNKKLIGDIKITGYKDLLNPALKGKIVAANPTASSSAFCQLTNMLNAIGKGNYESQEAWDFVKALFSNCVVIGNSSAVWKGVRDGEYAVGLSYEDPSVQLVRDGADVKVVYMKEGVVFLPAGSAIVKGAKNLENAKRFIDFIVSKPIQEAYSKSTTSRPIMAKVTTPPYMVKMKDIKVIKENMEYVEANKAKITARFKDIYTDLRLSAGISIKNAVKHYGAKAVIPGLSVEIKDKEFFTLLGPSGCGKTTLLRMIAGFNRIEGGDFYFDGKRINDLEPSQRNIGMVFQNYAIFPHYTVRQNVAFGLKNRKLPAAEIEASTDEFLKLMQITEFADRMPERLSGGQQQRVALARALVIRPDVLLMDEPLSNLDAKLRLEMRQAIRKLQKEVGITTVYVTHDQEEAMAISDRIAVMKDGVIQQLGSPQEIYQRPANSFVASFIGTSNLLPASLYPEAARGLESEAILSVRPEDFQMSLEPNGGIKSRITDFIFLGKDTHFLAALPGGQLVQIIHESSLGGGLKAGDTVHLQIKPEKINAFSADGSRNLAHATA